MSQSSVGSAVQFNPKQLAGLRILARDAATPSLRKHILRCCHSETFANEFTRAVQSLHSPFLIDDLERVVAAAEERMGEKDWLESFSGHPAIGGEFSRSTPSPRPAFSLRCSDCKRSRP